MSKPWHHFSSEFGYQIYC